ncbi:unnamed protein product [Mucor hiemalis]
MLSAGEAACFIYNQPITEENEINCIERLETAGLVPVYFANGDPKSPFPMGVEKVTREPWKYKTFSKTSTHLQKAYEGTFNEKKNCTALYLTRRILCLLLEISHGSSVSSFDVSVPTSRRAVIDLLKLIFPIDDRNTTTCFMSEKDVYNVAKTYFPEGHQITADKLNYWMGQEGYWPTVKRKRVDGERKSGRLMNLVKEEYRDFTLNDIANIQEYRRHIRSSSHKFTTIGYARKSKSEKSKDSIQNSINLQTMKLKSKLLCSLVYGSYSNANDDIEERDHNKKIDLKLDCDGDTQGT